MTEIQPHVATHGLLAIIKKSSDIHSSSVIDGISIASFAIGARKWNWASAAATCRKGSITWRAGGWVHQGVGIVVHRGRGHGVAGCESPPLFPRSVSLSAFVWLSPLRFPSQSNYASSRLSHSCRIPVSPGTHSSRHGSYRFRRGVCALLLRCQGNRALP